jgi:hypothetical protein
VATWQIPNGAGSFLLSTITITDGVSQDFVYIPGTVSGDHRISISIPGVGSLSDMVFSLLPGDPLSISHRVDTDRIIFSLRDRYDNLASLASLTGSLVYNAESSRDVVFEK